MLSFEKNLAWLRTAFSQDYFGNAYLLLGPEGTGKWRLAQEVTELINDLDVSKRETNFSGANPDILVIEPEVETKNDKSRKKNISVEQIEQIGKKMNYHSYQENYQVVLIREFEFLTATAANSLLKIVEEPTANLKFIFLSHNENLILSTIISRCQLVRHHLDQEDLIRQYLQQNFSAVTESDLKKAVKLAEGRIERAIYFLENPDAAKEAEKIRKEFALALKDGKLAGLELAEKISKDKAKTIAYLEEATFYLRSFVLDLVKKNAATAVIKKVNGILKKLVELTYQLKTSNVNVRLQLENFFVNL